MKKFATFILSAALALAAASCGDTQKSAVVGDDDDDQDEVETKQEADDEVEVFETFYNAPAYDTDEAIDPYDEDAYAQFGSGDDYDGPSDVDILDIELTEPYQIDIILDEMEENVQTISNLLSATNPDDRAIEGVVGRVGAIYQKISDNAEICTLEQVIRFESLSTQFTELLSKY